MSLKRCPDCPGSIATCNKKGNDIYKIITCPLFADAQMFVSAQLEKAKKEEDEILARIKAEVPSLNKFI